MVQENPILGLLTELIKKKSKLSSGWLGGCLEVLGHWELLKGN